MSAASLGSSARRVDLGRAGASGKQGHVPAGEVEMLEVLDLEHTPGLTVFELVPGRAGGGNCGDFVAGEFALRKDVEHLAPDIAGCTDDCDFPGHCLLRYANF